MGDVTAGRSPAGGPEPAPDERTSLANEEEATWEYDVLNPGDTAPIRWRTLVSAGKTPSSGLSMGVMEVAPGAQLAPHHHAPQEVYYVTDGEAEVYAEGAWRPLRAGDVAYFPGGAVHGARNRGASTCRIVWIFPTDTYEEVEYVDDEGP